MIEIDSMLDLVFWSFTVALTPPVVGVAWKLFIGARHTTQPWE
jgi:hypothetical protein